MPEILTLKNYSLDLQKGSLKYGVISSVDLYIGRGEIVGLIGESGSGKSMLWKSVLGLLDSQRWKCRGERTLNREDVAVILQDPMNAFDPVFKIEHHFIETAKAHRSWSDKTIRSKAAELLHRMNIRQPDKVLKMYPFQCSGGMLQRIMIAMAVMLDTALIIADEPTTSVDITAQREIISMLEEINRDQGASILYISHDLRIMENIADRIYVMYAGYMVESFPSEALREGGAKHPYTIKLLQSRPSYSRDYLPVMKGNPPTLSERQTGCPFASRCDHAVEKCRLFDMGETVVGRGHHIRCCRAEVLNESDRT